LKNETESSQIYKKIEQYLNLMLETSIEYNSNFIACVLEIAMENLKNFRLNASLIAQSCLNSLQQPLGIILLEEYLIHYELNVRDSTTKSSSKRLKLSPNSIDHKIDEYESKLWFELAQLYRSLDDYDSIKGRPDFICQPVE
jgi:hypothetical protein